MKHNLKLKNRIYYSNGIIFKKNHNRDKTNQFSQIPKLKELWFYITMWLIGTK